MTTTSGPDHAATWPPQRRPIRPRRFTVLRVLLQPRAAARLLQGLADETARRELMYYGVLKLCAQVHYSPSWRR